MDEDDNLDSGECCGQPFNGLLSGTRIPRREAGQYPHPQRAELGTVLLLAGCIVCQGCSDAFGRCIVKNRRELLMDMDLGTALLITAPYLQGCPGPQTSPVHQLDW